MPSLADLTRTWLARQLGVSSVGSQSDLMAELVNQRGVADNYLYGSGLWYGPEVTSNNATAAANLDELVHLPIVIGKRQRFDRIGITHTVAGTAGAVCRLGIYDSDDNGRPRNLLAGGATLDSTLITGLEEVIDVTLSPGVYWLAYVGQVAAATFRGLAIASNPRVGLANQSPADAAGTLVQTGVNGALPAVHNPATLVTGTKTPRILIRAA